MEHSKLSEKRQSPAGIADKKNIWSWLYAGVAVCAGLQIWVHLGLIGRGVEFIVSNVTIDDTYYYLQIAWNHAALGFPTFDGMHQTNGVQALWYFIILGLSFVAATKEQLLYLTLYTTIALVSLCYVPIIVVGRAIGRPPALFFLSLGWLYLNTRYRIFTNGMENALHALVIWTILAVSMIVIRDIRRGRLRWPLLWGLAVLLSVNVWVRVDAALLSLAVYAYLAWSLYRHAGGRAAVRFLVVAALIGGSFAALLLLAYYLMGGTPLPVSGQIKTSSFLLNGAAFFDNVWRGWRFTTPYLANVSDDSARRSVATLGILALLTLGSWALRRRFAVADLARAQLDSFHTAYGPYLGLFGVILASSVIHMLYLSGLGIFTLNGIWYITAYLFMCLIGFVMLSDWVWLNISAVVYTFVHGFSGRFAVRTMAAMLFILTLLLIRPHPHHWVSQTELQKTHHYTRFHISRQLAGQLPEEAIIASWNAGELGFFMDRPVINLDGLVNSYEYYQTVLVGDVSVLDYLDHEDVTHVIDSDIAFPDMPSSRWSVAMEWPVDQGLAERLIMFTAQGQ